MDPAKSMTLLRDPAVPEGGSGVGSIRCSAQRLCPRGEDGPAIGGLSVGPRL
jgi:hypothetical protein